MNQEKKSVLFISAIVNKEHQAELHDYLRSVMQVFGKNGGQPIARFKTIQSLLGDHSPEMTAIIAFPNQDIIRQTVNSDAFQALSELRSRVFSKLNLMICEEI